MLPSLCWLSTAHSGEPLAVPSRPGNGGGTAGISVKYLTPRDIARPHQRKRRPVRRRRKGSPPAYGRQALCRGYGGVPQTSLGWEGGKNNVHVAARTPTPPIAHNFLHTDGDCANIMID